MKTSLESIKVTWWRMGKGAVAKFGRAKAEEMAAGIINEGAKKLFVSGMNGEPRPRVRPVKEARGDG